MKMRQGLLVSSELMRSNETVDLFTDIRAGICIFKYVKGAAYPKNWSIKCGLNNRIDFISDIASHDPSNKMHNTKKTSSIKQKIT